MQMNRLRFFENHLPHRHAGNRVFVSAISSVRLTRRARCRMCSILRLQTGYRLQARELTLFTRQPVI